MPPDEDNWLCAGTNYEGPNYQGEPERPEDWWREERAWMRRRIEEIAGWLAVRCRILLAAFVTFTRPRRVIQQFCWSSRRWKSLT